jgi:hypothetical protein
VTRTHLLLAAAIVFGLVLTYPYLSLDIGHSRLAVRDNLAGADNVIRPGHRSLATATGSCSDRATRG